MDKEALKKLRLENLRKGRDAAKRRAAEGLGPKPEGPKPPIDTPPPVSTGNPSIDVPPPLEPMAPLGTPGTSSTPSAAGLISPIQAKAIGKIGNNYFKGMTTGLNFVVPKGITLEVTALEEAEEELLGSFMIPVIEKYLPRFKDSPEYALGVVAVGLYLGKIKVKRVDKKINLGETPPVVQEPLPEKVVAVSSPPPNSLKPKGLNLGNLEEKNAG